MLLGKEKGCLTGGSIYLSKRGSIYLIAIGGMLVIGRVNGADSLIHGNTSHRVNVLSNQGRICPAVGTRARVSRTLEYLDVLDIARRVVARDDRTG